MKTTKARKKHKAKLTKAGEAGKLGNHAEAEGMWREYLKDHPDDPAVNFNVGWCIEQRANCPADRLEASNFYSKVIESTEADMELKANAVNQIGLMCATIGDTEKAAVAFGFALKICPTHGAAKINLADAHRSLGDYKTADSEYRGILSQDPNNPEARMCSGMLALLLGDHARGWDLYRARFEVKTFTTKPFVTDKPEWKGEPLE